LRAPVYSSQDDTRQLRLRFDTPEAFLAEYEPNISKGGAFISTEDSLDLRETVRVVLDLAYRSRTISLEAEVVHVVSPELARVGGTPGVAVQFLEMAKPLRERLRPFVEAAEEAVAAQAPPAEVPTPGAGTPQPSDVEALDPSARTLSGVEASGSPSGAERRQWVREPTWVRVRLVTAEGALEGRTQDISHGGVLVSVEGDDVPLGAPVRVHLANPRSGDALEVDGSVVRRIEGEGRVVALAVRFDPSVVDRADVTSFVEKIQSADRARRLGGIRGDIQELGVANLLEMFGKSSPRGTLAMRRGAEEGVVAFEDRMLRYACLGSLTGLKALSRLLSWTEGSFEFHAHVDPLDREDAPASLDARILEALQHVDEANRAYPEGFDPGARLTIDRDRADLMLGHLNQTEAAVLDLADAGFTVRRILDVIPEPDARILEALRSLADQKIASLQP
jgi:uncharacterized protein (TIGR02266 family)